MEPEYEEIKNIVANNLYVVKENGAWKIINKDKAIILEDGFDDIYEINGNDITIKIGDSYGVIDASKEEKIPVQYNELEKICGDLYIAKNGEKYGIININNEIKLPFEYNNISYRKEAGIIEAQKDEINTIVYNEQIEEKITGILSEVNIDEGYIRARIGDEYKYYNFKFEEKEPKEVLENNNLYLSKKDGKYGFVNSENEVVVDYIYDDATEQNRFGYAAVKQNGVWGSINKQGKVVLEPSVNLDNNLIIDFIGKYHLAEELNLNYYID